jgi:hypothetical protein
MRGFRRQRALRFGRTRLETRLARVAEFVWGHALDLQKLPVEMRDIVAAIDPSGSAT